MISLVKIKISHEWIESWSYIWEFEIHEEYQIVKAEMFSNLEKFYQYAWWNNKGPFTYRSYDNHTLSSTIEETPYVITFSNYTTEISTCHFV